MSDTYTLTHEQMSCMMEKIYKVGMREGLMKYSFWKDGCKYTGYHGTFLERAINEVDNKQWLNDMDVQGFLLEAFGD